MGGGAHCQTFFFYPGSKMQALCIFGFRLADARMPHFWKKSGVQTLRILFSLCNIRGSITIVQHKGANCGCNFANDFENELKCLLGREIPLCNPGGPIKNKVARPDFGENARASHCRFWRKMRDCCSARFGSGGGLASRRNFGLVAQRFPHPLEGLPWGPGGEGGLRV